MVVKEKLFADVLFPLDLDELLAIEMEYQYRYISFMNLWDTEFKVENVYRYKDQVVDMRSTWQHVTSYLFTGIIGGIYSQTSSWNETIQRLDSMDANYKNNYLNVINNAQKSRGADELTLNDIFASEHSMYRVYLNTYNDGRYTGYQIHDDIVILNVTYQYKGEIYHVPYEDIDIISGGGTTEDPLDGLERNLQNLINTFMSIVTFINTHWSTIVVVVLIIVGIIALFILLYVISMFVNGAKTVSKSMNKAFGNSYVQRTNKYRKTGDIGGLFIVIVLIITVILIAKGMGWF